MSKKEKALLNHLVRIWRAPFLNDRWKTKYYIDAENFLGEHYEDWLKYIHSADDFHDLVEADKLPEKESFRKEII